MSSSFNEPTSVNCLKWVSKWHKIVPISPPLCVLCEIRRTPLDFWGIKLVYFHCAEGYLVSCAFYFSLQQWFHWDQFVHITTTPFFQKLGFAVTTVSLSKDFHLQVLTYTEFWPVKPVPCEFFWECNQHKWHTVWCNGKEFAEKHPLFTHFMYNWALKSCFLLLSLSKWKLCCALRIVLKDVVLLFK